jgi:hypothetical protein
MDNNLRESKWVDFEHLSPESFNEERWGQIIWLIWNYLKCSNLGLSSVANWIVVIVFYFSKVEDAFYGNKLWLNGQKLVKKSKLVSYVFA